MAGRVHIVAYQLIVFSFIAFFSGCSKKGAYYDDIPCQTNELSRKDYICKSLNENVETIQLLVDMIDMPVWIESVFLEEVNSSGDSLYVIHLSNGDALKYNIFSYPSDDCPPSMSVGLLDGEFVWRNNNSWLIRDDGSKCTLKGETPHFAVYDDEWYITSPVNQKIGSIGGKRDVQRIIDQEYSVSFFFLDTLAIDYPKVILRDQMVREVPKEGFYKDIFLDAGIGLTTRNTLSAANYLKASLECINFARTDATDDEINMQESIVGGSSDDYNGRLLYPDGQPRFKVLFVNGGSSTAHGKSLSDRARENMRSFVNNGGSYIGTCAGAFFAANGYDKVSDYPYYLNLWPGVIAHTGLSGVYTGMKIESDSPLLSYFDFGGDCYVSDVRHSSGGYPTSLPKGTAVWARFDYPESPKVDKQPCIWEYKPNEMSGSIILESSHPEEVSSGERMELTAAMIKYAMDHVGDINIKGFLHNGIKRKMFGRTFDADNIHCGIGDMQCHYFITFLPENVSNVEISLASMSDVELALYVDDTSFSNLEGARYKTTIKKAVGSISIENCHGGLWYITVKSTATVRSNDSEYGQTYSGNLDLLDGTPYEISLNWKKVQ